MGKTVLVTGGARSGKSSQAERWMRELESDGKSVTYIATGIPFDEEMVNRIKKHQAMRPSHWQTIEAYKGFFDLVSLKGHVLLDCLTIMVTNLFLEEMEDIVNFEDLDTAKEELIEALVDKEVQALIEFLRKINGTAILVTNEIGLGLVPEYRSSRFLRDLVGRVNQKIGSIADTVYFCISGIPMKVKGADFFEVD